MSVTTKQEQAKGAKYRPPQARRQEGSAALASEKKLSRSKPAVKTVSTDVQGPVVADPTHVTPLEVESDVKHIPAEVPQVQEVKETAVHLSPVEVQLLALPPPPSGQPQPTPQLPSGEPSGSQGGRANKPCNYYLRNDCKKGHNCKYSHAIQGMPPGPINREQPRPHDLVQENDATGLRALPVDFNPTAVQLKRAAAKYGVQLVPKSTNHTSHPMQRIERRLAREAIIDRIMDEYPEATQILDFRGDTRWWAAQCVNKPNYPNYFINYPELAEWDAIELNKGGNPENMCKCHFVQYKNARPVDLCDHICTVRPYIGMTMHSLAYLTPYDIVRFMSIQDVQEFYAATCLIKYPVGALCDGEVRYTLDPDGQHIRTSVGDDHYYEPSPTWVNAFGATVEILVGEEEHKQIHYLVWRVVETIGDTSILKFVLSNVPPRQFDHLEQTSLTDSLYWGKADYLSTARANHSALFGEVSSLTTLSCGSYVGFFQGKTVSFAPKAMVHALSIYVANRPRNKDTWDQLVARGRSLLGQYNGPQEYFAMSLIPACHIAFTIGIDSEIDLMLDNLPFGVGSLIGMVRPFVPSWLLHTTLCQYNFVTTSVVFDRRYLYFVGGVLALLLLKSRRDLVHHAEAYLSRNRSLLNDLGAYYTQYSGANWFVGYVPSPIRDSMVDSAASLPLTALSKMLIHAKRVDLVVRVAVEELLKRLHPAFTPAISIIESLLAQESFTAFIYRLGSHGALAQLPYVIGVALHAIHNHGLFGEMLQSINNALPSLRDFTNILHSLWVPLTTFVQHLPFPVITEDNRLFAAAHRGYTRFIQRWTEMRDVQLRSPWWVLIPMVVVAYFMRRPRRLTQADCDALATHYVSAPTMQTHTVVEQLTLPPVESTLDVPPIDPTSKVRVVQDFPRLGRPARLAGWTIPEALPVNYAANTNGELLAVTVRNLNPLLPITKQAALNHISIMRQLFSDIPYERMSFEEWNAHFPSKNQREAHEQAYRDSHTLLHPPGYMRVKAFSKHELLPHCYGSIFNMKCKRLIQGFYPAFNVVQGPPIYSFSKSVAARYNYTQRIFYANGTNAEQIGLWYECALADVLVVDYEELEMPDIQVIDGLDPAPLLQSKIVKEKLLRHRGECPVVSDFFNSKATVLAGDFSNFDGTQHPWLGEAECCVYEDVGMPAHVVETERKLWQHTSGLTAHGVKYSCIGRRKSGHPATSLGNSMLTITFFAAVFEKYDIDQYYLMVLGDDSLAVVHQDVSHIPWVDEALELGLVLKMAQPKSFEAEFCSSRFWPTNEGLVLAPKPFRVLGKTGWTLCDTNDLAGHIKGVVSGMQKSIEWMPLLRTLVPKVNALNACAHFHDERKILAQERHTICYETWITFELIYGVTREQIQALEQQIEQCDIPVAVSGPFMASCFAIDAGKDFQIRVTCDDGVATIPCGEANDTTFSFNSIFLYHPCQHHLLFAYHITITIPLTNMPTKKLIKALKAGRTGGPKARHSPATRETRIRHPRAMLNAAIAQEQMVRTARATQRPPRQPRPSRAEAKSDRKEDPAAMHALRAMLNPEIGPARLPDAYATGTAVFQSKQLVSLPWILDSTVAGRYYAGIYCTPLLNSKFATITFAAAGLYTWGYQNDVNYAYAAANFIKVRATGGAFRVANTASNLVAGGCALYGNASNNGTTGTTPPTGFNAVQSDIRLSLVQLNDPKLTRDVQAVWVPSDETALQFHAASDSAAPTDTDNFNSTAIMLVAWMDYVGGSVAPSNLTVNLVWNYEGLPYPTTVQPLDLRVAVGDESAIGRVLSHVRNVPSSVGNADTPPQGTEGWVMAARRWLNRIAPAINGAEAIYRTVAGGLWGGDADEYRAVMHFLGDNFRALQFPDKYQDEAEHMLSIYGITINLLDFIVPRVLAHGANRQRILNLNTRLRAQIAHALNFRPPRVIIENADDVVKPYKTWDEEEMIETTSATLPSPSEDEHKAAVPNPQIARGKSIKRN